MDGGDDVVVFPVDEPDRYIGQGLDGACERLAAGGTEAQQRREPVGMFERQVENSPSPKTQTRQVNRGRRSVEVAFQGESQPGGIPEGSLLEQRGDDAQFRQRGGGKLVARSAVVSAQPGPVAPDVPEVRPDFTGAMEEEKRRAAGALWRCLQVDAVGCSHRNDIEYHRPRRQGDAGKRAVASGLPKSRSAADRRLRLMLEKARSMPLSKKRRRPERTRRRGGTDASAPPPSAAPASAGGLLTRMRGGIQNVAGTGAKKRESPISKIVTLLLVLLAAYFVAKRFGLIP